MLYSVTVVNPMSNIKSFMHGAANIYWSFQNIPENFVLKTLVLLKSREMNLLVIG